MRTLFSYISYTCKNTYTDIIANNIAIPVNIPKYIVGIKLDITRIENPNTIVIEVFSIAFHY